MNFHIQGTVYGIQESYISHLEIYTKLDNAKVTLMKVSQLQQDLQFERQCLS